MFEPKQILVPTDFSPSAWTALQDGAEIADVYGAWLDVVHVWELPTFAVAGELAALPNTLIDAFSAQAQSCMEAFVSEARAKGVPIRNARVLSGNVPRMIVETAKAEDYDLIVIGSHGRTGLRRAVLGSVAERVVRHAPCPVLVASAKGLVSNREEAHTA